VRISRRLERLEAVRDGRECACPNPFEVRYYPGPDSGADAERDTAPAGECPSCGEPRTLFKVIYTDRQNGGGA
jgi:rubrerythrin